jgi:hypothetical protein
MNEKIVKGFFERWLTGLNKEFEKDFSVTGGQIDYVVYDGEQIHGVEVKGTRSNIYVTVGQLINSLRTLSHVYLLAPMNYIKKIDKVISQSGISLPVGYIVPSKEGVVYLKKPTPQVYYYKKSDKVRLKLPHTKQLVINESDIKILEVFKGKTLTVAGAAKVLNISMTNASHRLARLRKAKKIEELTDGSTYPKAYKIVSDAKMEETISLDT